MPIWPGENDWEEGRKAGYGGNRGPEALGPLGVELVPGIDKGLCEKLLWNTYVKPPVLTTKST